MTFEPGQRVVCVDADGAPQLRLKAIYTIRKVVGPFLQRWRGKVYREYSVFLHEAAPSPEFEGFAPARFRPIVERETDISVFTEMLKGIEVNA